jgi:hypothetical protein
MKTLFLYSSAQSSDTNTGMPGEESQKMFEEGDILIYKQHTVA